MKTNLARITTFILTVFFFKFPLPAFSLTADTSQTISYDTACALISNFLQNTDLGDFGRNVAIGGYIDSSTIQSFNGTGAPYVVLNFYSCYDNSDILKPKFYLALSEQKGFIPGTSFPDKIDAGDSLILSTNEFTYSTPGAAVTDVDKFLQNFAGVTFYPSAPEKKPGSKVQSDCFSFLSNYKVNSTPANYDLALCYVKDTVLNLLNTLVPQTGQKLSGLRYFLGYDGRNKRNSIRIIFFGVQPDGGNLIDSTILMVECGWPPGTE
jgi:hypothetical protein